MMKKPYDERNAVSLMNAARHCLESYIAGGAREEDFVTAAFRLEKNATDYFCKHDEPMSPAFRSACQSFIERVDVARAMEISRRRMAIHSCRPEVA